MLIGREVPRVTQLKFDSCDTFNVVCVSLHDLLVIRKINYPFELFNLSLHVIICN